MKQVFYKILIIILILILDFTLIFYCYTLYINNTHKEKLNYTKNLLLSLKNENDEILLNAIQENINNNDSHLASKNIVEK